MAGWTGGQTDKWKDVWTNDKRIDNGGVGDLIDEWVSRIPDGQMDGWLGGWINGQIRGWRDKCMGGQTNGCMGG